MDVPRTCYSSQTRRLICLLQCFTDTLALIKSMLLILEVNCLCPVCENLELLWTGIKKNCSDIDFPTKSHDFLEEVSCKPITQVCVDKKCKSCPSLDTDAINDCETIAFYMWKKRDKYYEKVLCEQTGEEIYNMLETQIDEIQEHYYRKHTQDAAYQA